MKTAFTAAQLAGPEIAAADGILRTCVHYGFCTAVCPAYVPTRNENEAPRGRIGPIRAMLERGGRLPEPAVRAKAATPSAAPTAPPPPDASSGGSPGAAIW